MNNVITYNEGYGVIFSGSTVSGKNRISDNSSGPLNGAPTIRVSPDLCGGSACP